MTVMSSLYRNSYHQTILKDLSIGVYMDHNSEKRVHKMWKQMVNLVKKTDSFKSDFVIRRKSSLGEDEIS